MPERCSAALTMVIAVMIGGVATPARAGDSPAPGARATVTFIGDNQFNNVLGAHDLKTQWGLSDLGVAVAIRPPLLDLLSPAVFRMALTQATSEPAGSRLGIIHLGDSGNIACTNEIEATFRILNQANVPWYMTPGNHDSYLMGNYDYGLAGLCAYDSSCGRPRSDSWSSA